MSMNGVVLATASYDHTIKLWNHKNQKDIHSIDFSTSKKQSQFQINKNAFFINRIEVSHDKQYLGAAGSFAAYVYDINSNPLPDRPKFVHDGYQNNVTSIGFKQNNGWIYTSSEDGSIKIHDLNTQGVSKMFSSKDPVNQVVLHPNEVELLSADQAGNVKIWDLRKDSTCRKKLTLSPEIGVRSISIAVNAQFFCAADSSGTLFKYKIGKNDEITQEQKIEKAHEDYILKCVISPLATSIATCSADKTIKIWSLNPSTQKFEIRSTLYNHLQWVWDCAFSCEGEHLFSCSSDRYAKLWELDKQLQPKMVYPFKGHRGPVNCVAFNDIIMKS